jgi:hypothetical protein
MSGIVIRKFFVALIIIVPIFSNIECKKQAKCGCGKDVLFTLTDMSAYIYWEGTGATISFQTVGDVYSTYTLCNPSEMFPKLAKAKSGDVLLVSGQVYWNCNYVYQSSNSTYSYQSMYKVYDVQVTDMTINLYGKNMPSSETQLNSANTRN